MISDDDSKRIREDAFIAHDALESLMFAPKLYEEYIAEKVAMVDDCLKSIKNFLPKE